MGELERIEGYVTIKGKIMGEKVSDAPVNSLYYFSII